MVPKTVLDKNEHHPPRPVEASCIAMGGSDRRRPVVGGHSPTASAKSGFFRASSAAPAIFGERGAIRRRGADGHMASTSARIGSVKST
jgi:hypothetical protein